MKTIHLYRSRELFIGYSVVSVHGLNAYSSRNVTTASNTVALPAEKLMAGRLQRYRERQIARRNQRNLITDTLVLGPASLQRVWRPQYWTIESCIVNYKELTAIPAFATTFIYMWRAHQSTNIADVWWRTAKFCECTRLGCILCQWRREAGCGPDQAFMLALPRLHCHRPTI